MIWLPNSIGTRCCSTGKNSGHVCKRFERRLQELGLTDAGAYRDFLEGLFHLVLCRNIVFTYFDKELQKEVLSRLYNKLYG